MVLENQTVTEFVGFSRSEDSEPQSDVLPLNYAHRRPES